MYAFGKYGAPLSSCWVVSGCYRQRGRLRTTAAAAEEESEDFFYFSFYEFLKIYAQLKILHFYIASHEPAASASWQPLVHPTEFL